MIRLISPVPVGSRKRRRSWITAIILTVLLAGCTDPHSPQLLNPHDPYSSAYVPNPPSDLAITSVSDVKRILGWHDQSAFARENRIERKLGARGHEVVIGNVPAGDSTFTDTSAVLTDTTYFYEISSVSNAGRPSPFDSLRFYLQFPSPTDLHMNCISPTSVELEWTDSSSFESGIRLLESVDDQPFSELVDLPKNATSYTVAGLNPADRYRFKVEAFTEHNHSKSSSVSISCVSSQVQLLYSRQVQQDNQWVNSLAFSPDGQTLACGGSYLDFFRVSDGKQLFPFPGHLSNDRVVSTEYSPDGKLIAAVWNGYVHLWDPVTNAEIWKFGWEEGPSEVWSCRFSVSGDSVVAATLGSFVDSYIQIWSLNSEKMIKQYEIGNRNSSPVAVDVSRNGQYVAASGDSLYVLRLADGSLVHGFPAAQFIGSSAFSPSGKIIATAGGNLCRIQLWSVEDVDLLETIQESAYAGNYSGDLAFSPAGDLLAVAGRQDGAVDIFNVQTGALAMRIPNSAQCICVAYNPQGIILVTGDAQGYIHVYGFSGLWFTDF